MNWFFLENVSNIEALIITVGKCVIHKARLKGTQPNITAMLNSLKLEAQKECYGAKARNCYAKYESKWGKLKMILGS